MNNDVLKNIILSMGDMFDKEKIELYSKLIDYSCLNNVNLNDVDEFYYSMISPHEDFIEGLLKTELTKNKDVIFIYQNYRFIEHHFIYWFEKIEGSPSCVDKASAVIKKLLMFYKDDIEKIEFDYDGEYTFHLPKKIFMDHDSIIGFYEGLKRLQYGNPTKYLESLNEIRETINNK